MLLSRALMNAPKVDGAEVFFTLSHSFEKKSP
jgi:hypothetical protein